MERAVLQAEVFINNLMEVLIYLDVKHLDVKHAFSKRIKIIESKLELQKGWNITIATIKSR